jgi:ubiquinone/menaquinone biosynthesis C-methylase UbiE
MRDDVERDKEEKMKANQLPPAAQLMRFIVGRWISKPIYAVAELGIADMLVDGPLSIEVLARRSQTHAPSLYRVMRALASVGVFSEIADRHFELTPMAECLRTGAMRSVALLFNSEWSDKAWMCFMDSVRTGETAFERAHGAPLSDWLEGNPETARIFNEANALKAATSHRAIIDVYNFSGIHTLIDVGGGVGALMAEILAVNPRMQGVIADVPAVIREAAALIRARGIEDRCKLLECDFFESIPPGGDAYLMSHILHDWPDDRCRTILSNCHRAMKPGARLLIIEIVIPPGNEPSVGKLLDIEMLVITGGRERTEQEFRTLLEASGFSLSRVVPTGESISIIEAVRI